MDKPSTGCVVDQAANSYWESQLQKGGAVTFPLGVRPPPGTLGAAVRSPPTASYHSNSSFKRKGSGGRHATGRLCAAGFNWVLFKMLKSSLGLRKNGLLFFFYCRPATTTGQASPSTAKRIIIKKKLWIPKEPYIHRNVPYKYREQRKKKKKQTKCFLSSY